MKLTRRSALALSGGLAQPAVRSPSPPTGIRPAVRDGRLDERGVNMIIGVGQGIDGEAHHGTARALGLAQIRPPFHDRLLCDFADPAVIAFETDDEPTIIVGVQARDTPNEVSAQMQPWRAVARAAGIDKPFFTNHVGDHAWLPGAGHGSGLPPALRLARRRHLPDPAPADRTS